MIISLHIPKTAGKSFKAALIKEFNSQIIFDYIENPQVKNISKFCKFRKSFNSFKINFYSKNIKIIHGHFCLDRYKNFLPNSPRICFAREPLKLLISYYDYIHLKYKNVSKIDPMHRKIVDSKLEDFLLSLHAQTFYSRMFGSFDYRLFSFIGIVEKYSESIQLFNKLYNTSLSLNHLNQTEIYGIRPSSKVKLSQNFKNKFKKIHTFNYAFYNYALTCFEKNISEN